MSYSPLDRPSQFLKGVGPARADKLRRLGLLTARDVLYHSPNRYEDATTVQPIGSLRPGADATVIGRVASKGVLPTRKGLRIFQAIVRDRTGMVECAWPGQPHLDRVIRTGDLLLLSGPVRFFHGPQLRPREWTQIAREGEPATEESGAVFPVYPATDGLPHRQVRKLIGANLDALLAEVADEEILEPPFRERAGVPELREALLQVHRPESLREAECGRRRLALEELFCVQLLHAISRHRERRGRPGIRFRRTGQLTRPFLASLPFSLTGAQSRVLREIGADMAASTRMTRLLQGDVGAGKTVVALAAMLRVVENGYQAALMAPTEVLAEQHHRTLGTLLGDLPVSVTLLTGSLGAGVRRERLASVAGGEASLVVGTHALIQETVRFHRLGLAVVDEQHRFGVRQRLALAEMGDGPDMLVMSATPIPRSLALTLYGDLDVSVLDERPPGRTPVRTGVRTLEDRPRVHRFVREQVVAGRQAFFIYPLVEESSSLALASATEALEELRTDVFPDLRLDLIHGQMPADRKERVMNAFTAGELDVLVATTVIEVGIDVPNATVMVVEHAERFGLSQLHQLRGRVGRGSAQSYCVLLASAGEARARLKVLAGTDDGFEIAREDLRIRGYGNLFGDRQSGLPAFRFADLERDLDLMELARAEARRIVDADPALRSHPELRHRLATRYEENARLFEVG